MYLQIPLYILVIKFLLSFFIKIDNVSEQIDSVFNFVLYIYLVCFVLSGIISLIILLRLYIKQYSPALLIAAILLLLIGFTLLYNYSGHLMFVIVPVIAVIYQIILVTAYGRNITENGKYD